MIEVQTYIVGHLRTNCYIIKDKDTGKMAIIDPGYRSKLIEEVIENNKENIEYILLTHGHFDHIFEVKKYSAMSGAKIVMGAKESDFPNDCELNLSKDFRKKPEVFSSDILLEDGQTIKLGNTEIKAIHTPGHTRGSMCYIIDNNIFSGDTLMKDTIGNTGFVTGSMDDMKKSLKKFLDLKEDYFIYSGHGDKTTLNYEKSNNMYLGSSSYDNLY